MWLRHPALLRNIFLTASLAIWLSALLTILRLLEIAPSVWLERSQELLILGLVIWILIRMADSMRLYFLQREGPHRFEPTSVNLIARLLQAGFGVLGLLVGMQILGYNISVLLTFGGIGSLVVGLAARDILANFLAGILIYLDPPFKDGDFICCKDVGIEGRVVETGWRITKIRAYTREILYVPNTTLAGSVVENTSGIDHRRIREVVGLRYADAALLPRVAEDIKTMLAEHAGICQEKPQLVAFDRFGGSSLDILVNAYTVATAWSEYMEIKHDVLLKIYAIVTGHGADIAFPTRTLDFPPRSENS